MIDPKLVENWNIVFALAEKGCGHSASYEAVVWDPRRCGGQFDNVQWILTVPCPEGCSSSPPPGLPTNPPPCDPDFEGSNETLIGCCEGIVQVECTGTCCLCGGVACEPSETCCDNVCVDLQTDHDHCSSCTIACEPSETCCAGDCIDTESLQTDVANCGYCGNTCLAGESCCSGSCVNVMGSDTSNCGGCGVPCASGKICDNGVCKDPCAANNCSWIWNNDAMGCCHTYTCFDHDPDTGDPQVGFVLTSDVSTNENCSTGDSACCNPPNPCLGAEYYIWSPDPCPMGCCKTYTCTENGRVLTSSVAAATAENCAQAPLGPCIDPDTQILDPTMIGNVSKYFHPNPCPPAFHALSTDEDENGTVRALAGSWTATATCPQGCNCPGEAPTADGTDGQVVTYECASCVPACGEGQECCGGECKNTNDDENNCGGCGIPCLFPLGFCCNGECCTEDGCCTVDGTPTCKDIYNDPDFCGDCVTFCSGPGSTTPQECCDGECKNLRTDPNNCRYCGSVCAEGETCCYSDLAWGCQNIKDSTFNCGSCDFQCAFDPALNIQCCNYECIPLNVSVNHCGSCYHPCGINETCCNGNCCPAGNTCCNGNCVNRNTDNNNCGNCGTVCVGGHSCVNGVCLACNPPCLTAGTACCNNSCIDIWSDESNCGSCGYACAPGFICCGGVCKNPLNDMYNCGDCGIECPQGINQINLWQCCNGVCRNLKTDPDNCGICGLTCQEPPGDTFTVPKCFLGNCAEPECECQGYQQGMPPQPGPNDVAFVASCVGNTASCDGSCYFDAVGGGWSLHEEPGYPAFSGTCGQEPDYTYCADDRLSCVDDKLACVGDIYFCVNNIEGQDMPTYCIPKASFDPLTQAKIGEYIGAENCAAGCSGDGSVCDPNPCPNGKTCCDSQCVDMQTDNAHCGSCDAAPCAEGEACKDGVCVGCPSPCASGESCCEGGTTCCKVCCADACCPTGQSCVDGLCATCDDPPCTAGQTCCGGSCCPAGRICCDQTCCAEGEFCENGSCATCNPVPYPDETCCNGTPVRWQCGECPNACASAEIVCCGLVGREVCCGEGQTCVDNKCYGCVPPCSESQDCCDEVCTELGTDTDCTGCGAACGEGTKCCDGSCIDVLADVNNCGGCGVVCDPDGGTPLCCDGTPTANGTNENCLSCGDTADPDNPTTPTSCCPSTIPVSGAPDTPTFVITNTNTDDKNCGSCGNAADTSDEAQEDCCEGEIVSLLTDPKNCGACGEEVGAGKLCCPVVQRDPNTGEVLTDYPMAGAEIDPQTDNDNCGSCGNKCNSPTVLLSPGEDGFGNPLPPVPTPTDSGTDCPEPGDAPFTKCKDGECVPCGTCNPPTNKPTGTPPYFHARTTIPCTYDPCGSVPAAPGGGILAGGVTAKTCYGGCTYRGVGNLNALQWELVSCACYDSCTFPGCVGAFAEAFGEPCPSVQTCSSGQGHCAGCRYLDYDNPTHYICPAPIGMGGSCPLNPLGVYGSGPAMYYCCDHEHPSGNLCGSGCPDVYEDGSQHFPTCGLCGGSCATGLTCCGDFPSEACTNMQTDESNCGSCGNACLEGQKCCLGSCTTIDNDKNNCGDCAIKCTGAYECCSGTCTDITNDGNIQNCGACGINCGTGKCCGGQCEATLTDASNCGSCGTVCPSGYECCRGECTSPSDYLTETSNCGSCANQCAAGESCCSGICIDCDEGSCCGFNNCCPPDFDCCSGECLPQALFLIDEANCGNCGVTCSAGQLCCLGQCISVQTDEANCGTCENACEVGELCCSGVCSSSGSVGNCGSCGNACGAGTGTNACCSGVCVNICGECGITCAADESCCETVSDVPGEDSTYACKSSQTDFNNCGTCGHACAVGETCCSGVCKAVQTDELNCGTCGNACAAGETCCAGSCIATSSLQTDEANCGNCGIVCTAGQTCCAGTCRDSSYFQTSDANCGECGNACETGETCVAGSCNLPPVTIKIYFQAYGCGGDCVYPYNSPSCVSSALTPGSRSMSYTTSWGPGGTISNSSSAISFGAVNVPVGTSITVSLSGYAGSGTLSHTRAATYPGSPPNPPTHTFFFNGYDDQGC